MVQLKLILLNNYPWDWGSFNSCMVQLKSTYDGEALKLFNVLIPVWCN